MKLKLIGCKVLWRELCALAALSPHEVEPVFLSHGEMRAASLEHAVAAPTDADYILLGCGACAADGLRAHRVPLVVPRAHDCAHLLMGNDTRYRRAWSENEDTPSWVRPDGCGLVSPEKGVRCAVVGPMTPQRELPELTREYGADLGLLRALLSGDWDERFLRVAPGFCVRRSFCRDILTEEPA